MRTAKKYTLPLIIFLVLVYALLRIFNANWSSEVCEFAQRDQINQLVYVSHARCRMDCRDISEQLVEQVYQLGRVNCDKSGEKNGDMRYALEMKAPNGDLIRIIIEDDNGNHIVITAIRLGKTDRCSCS